MTTNFPTDRLITAALNTLRSELDSDCPEWDARRRRELQDIVAGLGAAGTTAHLSVIGLVDAWYDVHAGPAVDVGGES